MNTITQKELLDYWLKDAQGIARSQYLDIDSNYNLIQTNLKGGNYFTKPKIEIDDNFENKVVIYIKYQTQPEHINITELMLSKPKFILRDKENYEFNKVIKDEI